MESSEIKENQITEILEKLSNIHYSSGLVQQSLGKIKAEHCTNTDPLEKIYHLVESHVPGLRTRAAFRYEKVLSLQENKKPLGKNHITFNCTTSNISENVSKMLERIKEMPLEWTLVQLTSVFNPKERTEISLKRQYTSSLYITVFKCGKNQPLPFCVNVKAPRDSTGSVVALRQELYTIINDNKSLLSSSRDQSHFKGVSDKQNYYKRREGIDERLKLLVKELQDLYLKGWRCLLQGKYVDSSLEEKVEKRLEESLMAEVPSLDLNERTMGILQYLTKGANYIKLEELRMALQSVIENKFTKTVAQIIRNVSSEFGLHKQKTLPLILIIDDTLDCFPWEMIDILTDKSVSRLPSLHCVYALFQAHKATIQKGFKIVNNPENGRYVINPDLDLKCMQNRILSFYDYWVPTWRGVSGCRPSQEEFEKMLTDGDIFAYNGHGSGSHLFAVNKLEKVRINAVVLLFGCSSTRLNILGPQTEMTGAFHTYLIACSPLIVGNLWEVTDLDTDILATELISQWIPHPGKAHWRTLDKTRWKRGEKVKFTSSLSSDVHPKDSQLLRILTQSKRSNLLSFYLTKAALVARGIPVKIKPCTN